MSYYVNKDAYRRTVKRLLGTLPAASVAEAPTGSTAAQEARA